MSELFIKFWDVKHGHATYLRSPNDRHIVVDLGIGTFSSSDTFSPLLHLKRNYEVNEIDYCIITHPHMDHIDDILNFRSLSPKVLLRPKHIPTDLLLQGAREFELPKIKEYISIHNYYNRNIESNDYDYPNDPDNYGGLKIKTYTPINCGLSNLNNQSIVAVFEFAGTKIVIPGDNESSSWNELLENDGFEESIRDADIYLASHHGRESGYHEDIVNMINPRLTIISDSRYHENSNIERYRAKSRGWDVFHGNEKKRRKTLSTYHDGVITVKVGINPDGTPYMQVNV